MEHRRLLPINDIVIHHAVKKVRLCSDRVYAGVEGDLIELIVRELIEQINRVGLGCVEA